MRTRSTAAAITLLLLAGTAAGCGTGGAPTGQVDQVGQVAPVANATSGASPHPDLDARHTAAERRPLRLKPLKDGVVVVGSAIGVEADGLAPGRTAELVWETVDGSWLVEDYFRFKGKRYAEATIKLGSARIDGDGRLVAHFAVPEDFGGVHNVVAFVDGQAAAQGGLEVAPSFELTPTEGPVGTPVEVRAKGLGWRTMDSTYVVSWDNAEVGWVSAVSTHGSAIARFRAAGSPGDHPVKLYTGWTGHSYLNYTQAPNAYLPRPEFLFRVTPGGTPPSAYVEPYAPQPLPAPDPALGGVATLTPSQGPVQTRARLEATGLPPNQPLDLVWETQAGSRVTETGFGAREDALGTATADASGALQVPVTVPDDLGGRHALLLRAGGRTLAAAHFTIETTIVSITPLAGPPGTPITVRLKGVGWTDYDNIYVATYDNAYMGYACGFNSQGDVTLTFAAAGAPGVHLVDFYPGIYQGPDNGQPVYRLPQLTYAQDHPGNRIPALRFAFTVTASPARRSPAH